MRNCILIALSLLSLPMFGQYAPWEGASEKTIIDVKQRLIADSTVDNNSDLVLWCDYRLECFRDSIIRSADVVIFNGQKRYYEPSPNNKIVDGYQGRENVILRRKMSAEGFIDWKIKNVIINQFDKEHEELKKRFNQNK